MIKACIIILFVPHAAVGSTGEQSGFKAALERFQRSTEATEQQTNADKKGQSNEPPTKKTEERQDISGGGERKKEQPGFKKTLEHFQSLTEGGMGSKHQKGPSSTKPERPATERDTSASNKGVKRGQQALITEEYQGIPDGEQRRRQTLRLYFLEEKASPLQHTDLDFDYYRSTCDVKNTIGMLLEKHKEYSVSVGRHILLWRTKPTWRQGYGYGVYSLSQDDEVYYDEKWVPLKHSMPLEDVDVVAANDDVSPMLQEGHSESHTPATSISNILCSDNGHHTGSG
eukprot:GHVU01145203.1.p1 GENE.GHVU01145203.1~~GHVU01145203.1.p1  ORF type:complete len:297 (-),score=41.77 GHVU01145203.1:138-992(-)